MFKILVFMRNNTGSHLGGRVCNAWIGTQAHVEMFTTVNLFIVPFNQFQW